MTDPTAVLNDPELVAALDTLAALELPRWAELNAKAALEGPTMTYNNVISRADAAAMIPEDVSEALLTGLDNESGVLGEDGFTRIPVAQSQTRLPILAALPVAYWVNGDTGLKQTTEVNWANKYLNIEELACIVPIPEAVLDDASFDVWGSIKPLLEQAIPRALDAAVYFGVNAPGSFPAAMVTSAIAAGNTMARGTTAAGAGGILGDFDALLEQVEIDGYDPDALIGHRRYKSRLRRAKMAAGQNYDDEFAAELKGMMKFPMRGLWGTTTGSAEAIAYQRDQFIVGVRQDFTYKVLDQAVIQDNTGAIIYNLAQQDMVALRVTFRAGWQVANTINYDEPTEANRYPAGVITAP